MFTLEGRWKQAKFVEQPLYSSALRRLGGRGDVRKKAFGQAHAA